MAKIRAKRSKVGAPKKKAPVKKAAPKKAAKAIKTELKNKGLKLPHGYGVEKRARVGSVGKAALIDFKNTSAKLYDYEDSVSRMSKLITNSKSLGLSPEVVRKLRQNKKGYQSLIKENKTHLRELKKLL